MLGSEFPHSRRHDKIPETMPPLSEVREVIKPLSRLELIYSLLKPFIAFLTYPIVFYYKLWILTPFSMLFIFIAASSVSHDIVHGALGLSKRTGDVFLFLYGCLLLGSGHAYKITHKQHHRVFPGPNDPEGVIAELPVWKVLLSGFIFLPSLWIWAFKRVKKRRDQQLWLLTEAIYYFIIISLAIYFGFNNLMLLSYAAWAIFGSWMVPFATVYLLHVLEDAEWLKQSRTLRGYLVPRLLMNSTYHLEHHMYPSIPSRRLPELANYLEDYLKSEGVKTVRVP